MTLCRAAALVVLTGSLLLPGASAQDKPHPIVAAVKANLKDPSKPFTMIVHIQVKEGNGAKFEEAFAKAIGPTRKEKGCTRYDLNRDLKKAGHYLIYERWDNIDALDAHLKTKHITTLLMEIGDMLASPPEAEAMLPSGE
jgi:quinol monooxygenase YgiN